MRLALSAIAAVLLAVPAFGQEQNCKPVPQPAAEFVDNFKAAHRAYLDKDFAGALASLARAKPFATGLEMSAILQLEANAYSGLKDMPNMIAAIERALAHGCLLAAVRRNYEQVLEKERG
jgi:hypothetical protein